MGRTQEEDTKSSMTSDESNIKPPTFQSEATAFSKEVSIAGLKYATDRDYLVIRRFIWGCLVIFGLGFATYQILGQIRFYISNPTAVNVEINGEYDIPFPTVTICSESIFNLSAVMEYDPTGLFAMNYGRIISPVPLPLLEEDLKQAVAYFSQMNVSDWNDVYMQIMTKSSSLIANCIFNRVNCINNGMLVNVMTDMGMCVRFNPDGNVSVQDAGSAFGLQLLLRADQHLYSVPASSSAGFRVNIHSKEDMGAMNRVGLKVGVNQHTQIQLSYNEITQLPEPYTRCKDDDTYSAINCDMNCYVDYVIGKCGCLPMSNTPLDEASFSICSPYKMATCVGIATDLFLAERILQKECKCMEACHEVLYPFTVTTAPTSEYFKNWISQRSNGTISAEFVNQNFVVLDIFFSTLQSEILTTVPSYSLLSLLCDIGGALGLILGSTILTAFEIGDFLLVAIYDSCKRRHKIQEVRNTTQNRKSPLA